MTKCGKSFLPECEYFATNGCVSPFNCPYKVENESITTATSTPCNLYVPETDKDKEISRLQAENAELRARLDRAIELPYVKRDCEFTQIIYKNSYGDMEEETYFHDCYYGERHDVRGDVYAEARLKELQGGER